MKSSEKTNKEFKKRRSSSKHATPHRLQLRIGFASKTFWPLPHQHKNTFPTQHFCVTKKKDGTKILYKNITTALYTHSPIVVVAAAAAAGAAAVELDAVVVFTSS